MQTVQLKYDVILWITRLRDKKLLQNLHPWKKEPANDAPFDENHYLLSNEANAEHLRKSVAQDKAGKIKTTELYGDE